MAAEEQPSASPPAPHLGPIVEEARADYDRFDAAELAIVLSHYDLGVIKRIREFRRGSRRSPKLRISAKSGEYLLKRRAPGRDDPRRVAFTHELQLFLQRRNYPIAPLIGTRDHNNSMIHHHGRMYELFGYVRGQRDDRSSAAAVEAGRALGRLHRLLREFETAYESPVGSYHGVPSSLDAAIRQAPTMIRAAEPDVDVEGLERRCKTLRSVYHDAMRRADAAGIREQPVRFIHGDWHPGNLLFDEGRIVAVLDFDSARLEPRMIDIANAAIQFSMPYTASDDPGEWPDRLEVRRIRALLRGYDESSLEPISEAERLALPWLILEALIIESLMPIAATGRFGHLKASAFLAMVERKARWVHPRGKKLLEYLET